MKPNTENGSSLPFGKHGEIQIVKTIVRFSAKGLPFQGENFDILRTELCALHGFQNVIVEPDSEDVAINVAFDCEVEGCIRSTKGLLRSTRKKIQKAMAVSYKCLHCMDSVLNYCPYCAKRKEEQALGDHLDRMGEMASRHEDDETISDDEERSYCPLCHEPIDECQCSPDDHDDEPDEIKSVENS